MQLMFYAKNFLKMDKIDRLLDAMEHPERYSATEIETMLQDSEVKDAFDLFDKTKSSLQTIISPDVEEEWKRFENNHNNSEIIRRFWLSRIFSRNVAASIVVGIASFAAVAAIVGVGIHHILTDRVEAAAKIDDVTNGRIVSAQPDTVKQIEDNKDVTPEIVVFDDDTFETIISKLADYYDYEVIFDNASSKSLRLYFRWNQANSIEEVIGRLNNFEQINLTVNDKTIKVE